VFKFHAGILRRWIESRQPEVLSGTFPSRSSVKALEQSKETAFFACCAGCLMPNEGMRSTLFLSAYIGCLLMVRAEPSTHIFRKTQLSDKFWCEGATFGDFNHDGKRDIVAGPYWYEGPDFKTRHELYPATTTFSHKKADGTAETIEGFEGALGENNTYSDNFFAFARDFNKDGWDDVLIIAFPGKETAWFENPKGGKDHWKKHVIFDVTDNESPTFTDITGDGKPELVCASNGVYGYAEPDWNDAAKPWKFHPISPNNKYQRFTHGMGVGDVNGDGRQDLLEKDGWWEQPASLANDQIWTFHPFSFNTGSHGGAQMYAYDVNGDGLNDVITSFAAHGFGLVWYEQTREKDDKAFIQHVILNTEQKRSPNKHGVSFSELHALDLIDVDGDGLKDIVTGKRFWSHGRTGDPDRNSAAVLYWFKLVRNADKTAEFVPNLIDEGSGVGTQVVAAPCSNEKLPDIVVANKKGTFYFRHELRKIPD
jgi:hypothetical protein